PESLFGGIRQAGLWPNRNSHQARPGPISWSFLRRWECLKFQLAESVRHGDPRLPFGIPRRKPWRPVDQQEGIVFLRWRAPENPRQLRLERLRSQPRLQTGALQPGGIESAVANRT